MDYIKIDSQYLFLIIIIFYIFNMFELIIDAKLISKLYYHKGYINDLRQMHIYLIKPGSLGSASSSTTKC